MYRGAVSGATRLLMPNMANDIRMSCSTTRRIVPASVRPAIRLTSSPLLAIRKATARRGQMTSLRLFTAPTATVSTSTPEVVTRDEVITSDPYNNVTDNIFAKLNQNHHLNPDHPLGIIKKVIFSYFDEQHNDGEFTKFDSLKPVVSATMNFDEVLVPKDHVSRDPNDTYYVDQETVLRCHTSAHQASLLRAGNTRFLVTGDVYRRDSIDATHYPAFHQMEGVRVFEQAEWEAAGCTAVELAERELKRALEGMVAHLFGEVETRWVDAYFPFTEPSFELEIFFQGEWLEVLGCGVMQQQILDSNAGEGKKAWAFGLGLERLAMILFDIPDIRLFWTNDERFTSQFKAGCFQPGGVGAKFQSFSKFPPCLKDVSFWVNDKFTENNLCETVRNLGGDLVESVTLIDDFTNPKTNKRSNCFRITYRSMERSLTNEEIDDLQENIRGAMETEMGLELR
mmetsp:Transcript_37934/g.72691  ORF Transcript_37934/g.72691 Transcript_37934/m.72691 type:complete len:454 (-) Transcript_37934:117-1478(-)